MGIVHPSNIREFGLSLSSNFTKKTNISLELKNLVNQDLKDFQSKAVQTTYSRKKITLSSISVGRLLFSQSSRRAPVN